MHLSVYSHSLTTSDGVHDPLRGVAGPGVVLRVSDRTAGRTITRIRTGKRVHPAYSGTTTPLV